MITSASPDTLSVRRRRRAESQAGGGIDMLKGLEKAREVIVLVLGISGVGACRASFMEHDEHLAVTTSLSSYGP